MQRRMTAKGKQKSRGAADKKCIGSNEEGIGALARKGIKESRRDIGRRRFRGHVRSPVRPGS